jgi:hypothetical protein
VSSPLGFHGAGLRVGGEGHWALPYGFRLFGRASGSLLVGDFHTSLLETNGGGRIVDVNVAHDFEKLIPVLELGVGVAWRYRNFTVSAGYELTDWANLVNGPDFVDDVHLGKLSPRTGDLTLDGFVFQVEMSY